MIARGLRVGGLGKRMGGIPVRGFLQALGLSKPQVSDEIVSATDKLSKQVTKVHEDVLEPLNQRLLGPLGRASHEMLPRPTVFVLGNHSSGKSTFINYLLGQGVQDTGVAPTDDGFTVIVPGRSNEDQDGPSLVGDPDLGFSGLRAFGSPLVSHVKLKVRAGLALRDVMVIDSPGMIDSPMLSRDSGRAFPGEEAYSGVATSAKPRDRGFNFPGVVRWFAERSDVILLFFDPDKPGTTGETLGVMKEALVDLEYKTHFILNKSDQFERTHDFARAYGSLCWNLSKVIPRKDLPRIYTTCVPLSARSRLQRGRNGEEGGGGRWGGWEEEGEVEVGKKGLLRDAEEDLASSRRDIVAEVRRAPARQVDNMITRTYDAARLLKMHAEMLGAVRQDVNAIRFKFFGGAAGASSILAAAALAAFSSGALSAALGLGVAAVGGGVGLVALGNRAISTRKRQLLHEGALEEIFQRHFFLPLAKKDDFVVSLWDMVKPQLRTALSTFSFSSLPVATSREIARLDNIAEAIVPALRRQASKAAAFLEAEIDSEYSTPGNAEQNEQETVK